MPLLRRLSALIWMAGFASVPFAQDLPGSADFPGLPRVSQTRIVGYQQQDFAAGRFIEEVADAGPRFVEHEGALTQILYFGQPSQTPLQMLRNYATALEDYGKVQERFRCAGDDCPRLMPSNFIWAEERRIPVSFKNQQYLYMVSNTYASPAYWYGTVLRGDTLLHVSLFSATIQQNNSVEPARNRPTLHLEILEVRGFDPTLEFVDATQMRTDIEESGRVVLYGIQFDHDSATIRGESERTLEEIAKALRDAGDLNLYVVGHTDSRGALDYNRELSRRRADAVVKALQQRFGIDGKRLTPVGVGPVAPVAGNSSDAGRARNRRVELVQR